MLLKQSKVDIFFIECDECGKRASETFFLNQFEALDEASKQGFKSVCLGLVVEHYTLCPNCIEKTISGILKDKVHKKYNKNKIF